MPPRVYNCLTCGASLPIDKPATQKSIACTYCSQANANPNFIENTAPIQANTNTKAVAEEKVGTKTVTREIEINQSTLALIYCYLTSFAGISLYAYFWFNSQPLLYYLLVSIFMASTILPEYFSHGRWEKVAIRETVKSQEKYEVVYSYQDSGLVMVINAFGSYIFLVWFTFLFFMKLIPVFDNADGNILYSSLLAFFLPMPGVWIILKTFEDLGKSLGRAFSK